MLKESVCLVKGNKLKKNYTLKDYPKKSNFQEMKEKLLISLKKQSSQGKKS